MAWEICMSGEGWADLYDAINALDRATLIDAIANDNFIVTGDEGRTVLAGLTHDVLADEVYARVQDHRTCDNGGFSIWLDRGGFSKVDLP